jgi:hypothetical protein
MIEQKLIDKIKTASEVEHYMFIQECGDFIFTMEHGLAHGDIPTGKGVEEDVKDVRELQEYVVSQLGKFDVDPKSTIAVGEDRKDSSYWKWFEHWHTWHKEELTNEEWQIVSEKLQNEEDLSEYLPKKKWNE